jgi:hypothetical protein
MLTKSLDEPGYSRKLTSPSDRYEPTFSDGLAYPKGSELSRGLRESTIAFRVSRMTGEPT